jgi:hypothetical protein
VVLSHDEARERGREQWPKAERPLMATVAGSFDGNQGEGGVTDGEIEGERDTGA